MGSGVLYGGYLRLGGVLHAEALSDPEYHTLIQQLCLKCLEHIASDPKKTSRKIKEIIDSYAYDHDRLVFITDLRNAVYKHLRQEEDSLRKEFLESKGYAFKTVKRKVLSWDPNDTDMLKRIFPQEVEEDIEVCEKDGVEYAYFVPLAKENGYKQKYGFTL